jgi:hypothetical protein
MVLSESVDEGVADGPSNDEAGDDGGVIDSGSGDNTFDDANERRVHVASLLFPES